MKKTILAITIAVIIFIVWATPVIANTTTSEVYIPSETTVIDFIETTDKEELKQLIDFYNQEFEMYSSMLEAFDKIHGDYSLVIQETNNKIDIAKTYLSYYQKQYDKILKAEEEELWKQKSSTYPAAAQIWKELKDFGYNDYICAGILGNIMAEVGGQTLNLDYKKYSSKAKGYYGICQWSKTYEKVWNTSLEQQIDFLTSSIHYEFDTYGFKYSKNFKYEDFCNLTNEKDAALAFAKCYERCAKASYNQRQKNATKAYNYFVN